MVNIDSFPAVLGCAIRTFYVLTNTVNETLLIASTIQALLASGLFMHHHLRDISSHLQATPRKLTTVALVASTLGVGKTPVVEFVYFLLA